MFYPKTPFYGKGLLLENGILKVNSHELDKLLSWLCKTPRITTYRINTLRTSVADYKLKLETKLSALYGSSAPLVYGLKEIPEMLCISPLDTTTDNKYDDCRKELIVDTSCGAAVLRGAHIYAPGVLAMESGTQLHELVNVFADLPGKCKRGTSTRYDCNEKIFIGVGEVLMQRHQLYNNKEQPASGIAVRMQTNVSGVPTLGDLSDGDALLQNLPSMVCVRVLDPQPGERILDMCAAPGNKTTHMAELICNRGTIIALDNSASRVRSMTEKLANYTCITAHQFDATKAWDDNNDIDSIAPPFASGSFDRILLDAPCSGLGNRPQLWLRPGGILVYSTCTVTEAECEEIVSWALRKYTELQLVDATPKLGAPGLPLPDLEAAQCDLLQRFGPSRENRMQNLDTVGFFIAKFQKTSD
ncbi:PREDICTED: LOW QUALITY PROTEIN: putative methyltransferase NSUN6 [Drosophila arizonae]|uniref:LOW QUALITY PROTEIN: putative methyltransferase NSUN6 n=1 Tax=Drosophila arizonae TaxID=7263 RepID=A0ABM1P1B8_DROAR|nr:PREDICTED: LOW QUALITY PROTEIN: putative methyltransferase NSUN6 [Drosophila arizonae]